MFERAKQVSIFAQVHLDLWSTLAIFSAILFNITTGKLFFAYQIFNHIPLGKRNHAAPIKVKSNREVTSARLRRVYIYIISTSNTV